MPDEVTPPSGAEELREKYNTAERDKLAKEGKALPDGSYPIGDAEDLHNAATLAASGHGDVDAAKTLIHKRAKELGVDVESLPGFGKENKSADADTEERAECSTCDGSGKIMDGHRECPDCNGTGEVQQNAAETTVEERASKRRKERRRAVPLGKEFRFVPLAESGVEVREKAYTNELIVTGKPIKYGVPYSVRDPFGKFKETMHPGCAESILGRVDCRFLVNHEGIPMARVKPERGERNTMRLWDTPEALCFEARLDARQQIANDFAIALERGDIDEMSVGMQVGRDEWGMSDGEETRDIYGLDDLLDVSGVTYAASPTTSVEIAKRMALECPVESRARIRQLEVALRSGRMTPEELADLLALLQGNEERISKVLSKENQGKLVDVAKSIHSILSSAGYNPSELLENDDAVEAGEQGMSEDGSEGAGGSAGGEAPADGTLARSETINDPGEGIRATKTARVLAMELEARRHRRKAA